MEIKLYNLNNERNAVQKLITVYNIATIEGTFREKTSVTDPEIVFEMENVPNFNYVRIPDLQRYYFVVEMVSVRNKLWSMKLHVDVLFTYKTAILAQTAVISRNQGEYNRYLIDDKIPAGTNQFFMPPLVLSGNPFTPQTAHSKTLVLDAMFGVPPTE